MHTHAHTHTHARALARAPNTHRFNETTPCVQTREAESSALTIDDFWVLFLILG